MKRLKMMHHKGDDAAVQAPAGRLAVWGLMALLLLGAIIAVLPTAQAADVTVYRNASCGCCGKWANHMQEAGFKVDVQNTRDLNQVKSKLGIPLRLQACHTAVVDGYVIEGHVPAADVKRLLAEKPDIRGLSVPGMPAGSPGMPSPRPQAYKVLAVEHDGNTRTFAQH